MLFGAHRSKPWHLTAWIVGITVALLATLLWLGRELITRDRIIENQQTKEHLDRGVDLVVAALQRALSVSNKRLVDGTEKWADGSVVIVLRNDTFRTYPEGRMAFVPVALRLPEAPVDPFIEGEEAQSNGATALAVEMFRNLTHSSSPAVRAGAFLRLGNILTASGQIPGALAAYEELSRFDDVASNGVPLSLVGQFARCRMLETMQRQSELRSEGQHLATDLVTGRWKLTDDIYLLYMKDAARWIGAEPPAKRQAEVFSAAAGNLWERRHSLTPTGSETLALNGENLTVMWQNTDGVVRALIATPGFVNSEWLAAGRTVAKEQGVSFQLGDNLIPSEGQVRRTARQTDLPWSIVAAESGPASPVSGFTRRGLILSGLIVLVSMTLAASFAITRAVRKELAVARLQSDFVAAVSHEFRTPLTSLRQFTDMLRENTTLSESRRRICYEAQSRAADRLTRLVESLLDFGRMEAGAHRYMFIECDSSNLIGRVTEDFGVEVRNSGYQIKVHGNGAGPIEADSEALSRAVTNLLENAVKYSPDHRVVEVEVCRKDKDVRIAVRDRGIGVPVQERSAIFGKFYRGDGARTRGIKGTGIGLAMVDEIVKAHHGRVEVESEPGSGSTFTIVLPAKG